MQRDTKVFILLLMALAGFAAFFELGLRDVVEDNEGQRAVPAAEMIRSGDYVIPTLNGKDYLAKPPLIYWLIAGVYGIAGDITPTLARIPAAIAYILLALSVYLYARSEVGEISARIASLAVVTSPYLLDRARYAELDVPLTLVTFLAIVLMHRAMRAPGAGRAAVLSVVSGLFFGAGLLLKGPAPALFMVCGWLAFVVLDGGKGDEWIKSVAPWTVAAFVVGFVTLLSAFILPGLSPRFPIALALMSVAWIYFAFRHGSRGWRPFVVPAIVLVTGAAVAGPWASAVVIRKGWPFVMSLLQSEALERTHTATAINSGTPVYYLLGLTAMLAPWGLLLPCQASRETWRQSGDGYRLAAMTGWLGVLLFSLIAGKEYEYVLPAAPFLLIAAGYQLEKMTEATDWSGRWIRVWSRLVAPVLAVGAVGLLIAVLVLNKGGGLHAEAMLLGAVALLMGWAAVRQRERRYMPVAVLALCTVMIWTLSQTYRYTGERSPREIADLTRDLLSRGYDVEAAKMTTAFDVFPGFAFHAGVIVPTTSDPERILSKLQRDGAYYCVVSEKMLEKFPGVSEKYRQALFGPYTKKKLVVIGNQALPDLPRE